MDQNKLEEYARILIQRGCNIREDQPLYVDLPLAAAPLAPCLLRQAKATKAGAVHIHWTDDALEKECARLEAQDPYDTDLKTAEAMADAHCAYLLIETVSLKQSIDLPAETLAKLSAAHRAKRMQFQTRSGGTQSCIALWPTQEWAKLVYPELPKEEALEQLWSTLFKCVRADALNGIEEWDTYIENTGRRKKLLDERGYTAIHYKSDKTDLTVDLQKEGHWQGGNMVMKDGRIFVPNIPTEEIFHAPDSRTTEGIVTSTLPLNVSGSLIKGLWLRFEKGVVTDFGAESGKDVLASLLNTDEGAKRLGEVAIIDEGSPISSLKRVFYHTLFDENASCHMAIGLSAGPKPSDRSTFKQLGLNDSAIHVDFMVGSDKLDIYGKREDGSWEPILIQGHWVEQFL